jgi:uncharacterized protein
MEAHMADSSGAPIPAIDLWAPFLPFPEILEHVEDHFPLPQLGYLRVFWKREPTIETFRALVRDMPRDPALAVAAMDAAGVQRTLVTGFDETSTGGTCFCTNEAVAAAAAHAPGRIIPFAGADILRGADGVRAVRHWVSERGFKGLSLRPFMTGLPADDRRYYPFYETCVELGVPISMHASANWTTDRPSDLGHPRHFDQVACDFPELRLILSHAGYPWVLEACLLAWKHPNVYLELAAHRPKYFVAPGAGWEPLMRFGATTIRDKVVWGSGTFLIGRSQRELADEMRALPLPPAVLERWLWRNAAEELGL